MYRIAYVLDIVLMPWHWFRRRELDILHFRQDLFVKTLVLSSLVNFLFVFILYSIFRGDAIVVIGSSIISAITYNLYMIYRRRSIRKIHPIPGHFISTILRFLFGKRLYSIVFEPQLSDHRLEYIEAIHENRVWEARWIWVRCSLMLLTTAAAQLPVSFARICERLWKATTS